MKILRVFPCRTSITPDDDLVVIGYPELFTSPHDEVHISCTFTWDMDYCENLKCAWEGHTKKPVLLGGPAYASPCNMHMPGVYTKKGVVFTSRGCNNNCPWCFVPKREGKLKELPVLPGNIINDNNFLQCSQKHQSAVFDMLHSQRQVVFAGGLDCRLINSWFAERLAVLQAEHKVKTIFLACDTTAALTPLQKAISTLIDGGFRVTRDNTHCYVLCYAKDIAEDEKRLRAVYEVGVMPRCQLYRAPERVKTKYLPEIERWARQWQRPAATRQHMEKGTSYNDYDAQWKAYDRTNYLF